MLCTNPLLLYIVIYTKLGSLIKIDEFHTGTHT